MVTNFKRHQLTDLNFVPPVHSDEDCQDEEVAALQPSLQQKGSLLLSGFARDPYLTEAQLSLLREIEAEFHPEENAADLSILYEVTGYKGETPIGAEYW